MYNFIGSTHTETQGCITLVASASLICLKISPLRGAGTVLNKRYASRVLSRTSYSSLGAAHRQMSIAQLPMMWRNTNGKLTDCTRARTSPVVGQTLSNISPVPFHSPSYTPGSSSEVEMSRADNIVEARLDRFLRAEDTARIPKNAFLDRSIVAAKGRHRVHDPSWCLAL